MRGHGANMGERRDEYIIFFGRGGTLEHEGKGLFQIKSSRQDNNNNNKIHLQVVGCGGMDLMELAQNRDR